MFAKLVENVVIEGLKQAMPPKSKVSWGIKGGVLSNLKLLEGCPNLTLLKQALASKCYQILGDNVIVTLTESDIDLHTEL
jgi:hypothetical protein